MDDPGRGTDAMHIPVGPVRPDRRPPRLARLLAVPALIAVVAFTAGLWLGQGAAITATRSPTAVPSPALTAAATASEAASAGSVPVGPSEFAQHFDPLGVIAAIPDGDTCHGGPAGDGLMTSDGVTSLAPIPGVRDSWYGKAWLLRCAIPPSDPISFTDQAVMAVAGAVPSTGYGGVRSETGSFAEIPYRESGFAGVVTVGVITTDDAGLEISVTLVERPAP